MSKDISELMMMENENKFPPKVFRHICMNQKKNKKKMDGRAA